MAYFQNALGLKDPAPPGVDTTFDYIAYVNGTDGTNGAWGTNNTGFGTGYLPPLNSSVDDVSFLGYNPDIEGYNMTEADYAWDYTPPDASPIPSRTPLSDPKEHYHSSTAMVPGQGGQPGCAYVIAGDLGSSALCSEDYCNCGGVAGPLITQTVSGSLSTGCAYHTQPTANSCAQTPPTSSSIATAPTASLYCSDPSPEDSDGRCTCNQGTVTTTVTPSGGACPTSI